MNTDTRLANFHFSFVLYTHISIFSPIYYSIYMGLALIDPLAEINASHLGDEAKGLMRNYCALVH